mmetsp:Transcript_39401/g.63899  ORF Transcript_39401/g.63899 Transcript_39401/m.63899 type:complete len:222 (+) Transcript_39401:750-1415(+)
MRLPNPSAITAVSLQSSSTAGGGIGGPVPPMPFLPPSAITSPHQPSALPLPPPPIPFLPQPHPVSINPSSTLALASSRSVPPTALPSPPSPPSTANRPTPPPPSSAPARQQQQPSPPIVLPPPNPLPPTFDPSTSSAPPPAPPQPPLVLNLPDSTPVAELLAKAKDLLGCEDEDIEEPLAFFKANLFRNCGALRRFCKWNDLKFPMALRSALMELLQIPAV